MAAPNRHVSKDLVRLICESDQEADDMYALMIQSGFRYKDGRAGDHAAAGLANPEERFNITAEARQRLRNEDVIKRIRAHRNKYFNMTQAVNVEQLRRYKATVFRNIAEAMRTDAFPAPAAAAAPADKQDVGNVSDLLHAVYQYNRTVMAAAAAPLTANVDDPANIAEANEREAYALFAKQFLGGITSGISGYTALPSNGAGTADANRNELPTLGRNPGVVGGGAAHVVAATSLPSAAAVAAAVAAAPPIPAIRALSAMINITLADQNATATLIRTVKGLDAVITDAMLQQLVHLAGSNPAGGNNYADDAGARNSAIGELYRALAASILYEAVTSNGAGMAGVPAAAAVAWAALAEADKNTLRDSVLGYSSLQPNVTYIYRFYEDLYAAIQQGGTQADLMATLRAHGDVPEQWNNLGCATGESFFMDGNKVLRSTHNDTIVRVLKGVENNGNALNWRAIGININQNSASLMAECIKRNDDDGLRNCYAEINSPGHGGTLLANAGDRAQYMNPVACLLILKHFGFSKINVGGVYKLQSVAEWQKSDAYTELKAKLNIAANADLGPHFMNYINNIVQIINDNCAIMQAAFGSVESSGKYYQNAAVMIRGKSLFNGETESPFAIMRDSYLTNPLQSIGSIWPSMFGLVGGNGIVGQYGGATSKCPKYMSYYNQLLANMNNRGVDLDDTSKKNITDLIKQVEEAEKKINATFDKYLNYIKAYEATKAGKDLKVKDEQIEQVIKRYQEKLKELLQSRYPRREFAAIEIFKAMEELGKGLNAEFIAANAQQYNRNAVLQQVTPGSLAFGSNFNISP